MHMRLWPLAAAFAFAAATPVAASNPWVPGWEKVDPIMLSGILTSPDDENSTSFLISSPGTYRLSWIFDRPLGFNPEGEAEGVVIFHVFGWVLDDYEGGEWKRGTSEEFDDYLLVSSSGSRILKIPEPRIYNHDEDGYYQSTDWDYLSGFGLYADYTLAAPLGYRLTLAQVPEPASWAMMIAGFGLVGGALRRKGETLRA